MTSECSIPPNYSLHTNRLLSPSSAGNEDDEDVVDSDFSIDENDEPLSDNDDEAAGGRKKSKRIGVVTKAYKEPPKVVKKKATTTTAAPAKPTKTPASPKKTPSKAATSKSSTSNSPRYTVFDSGRKSFRKSTALKTAATQIRMKQRTEDEKKKKKYIKVTEYIPTQEELLAEAVETEKENVKSLEKFMRLEMEKKRTRPTKRQPVGPIIRYHSMSLPLIQDLDGKPIDLKPSPIKDEPMDVDASEEATSETKTSSAKRSRAAQRAMNTIKKGPRYERTFITFDNDVHDKLFDKIFKKKRGPRSLSTGMRSERGKTCPITKLPARYFDPVTKVPYRSVAAFKIIREAYYRQLEERGNPENPQVAKWLVWRRQYNAQRLASNKAKARLPSTSVSN